MQLGYNTNGFAHHRLEDALTILAEIGYTSVAITLDHNALNPIDDGCATQLEHVASLLKRLGLRCVIETGARFLLDPRRKHQPTLLSIRDADAERRADFLVRSIAIAGRLGADAVSFWSGSPTDGQSRDACMARLVGFCRTLCEAAKEQGVKLAFEPEPGMFIDTMDKFAELHERVAQPNFGLTLDVGHLHCMAETPIAEHIVRWKDWLWNVHIEDMRKGVHDHLMFGDGEMEFPPIFAALNSIDYEGGVHVELSRHSHNAVETARHSLEFMRSAQRAGSVSNGP